MVSSTHRMYGTESAIENDKQFDRHAENGGMFAVDKEDWMKYLENGEKDGTRFAVNNFGDRTMQKCVVLSPFFVFGNLLRNCVFLIGLLANA